MLELSRVCASLTLPVHQLRASGYAHQCTRCFLIMTMATKFFRYEGHSESISCSRLSRSSADSGDEGKLELLLLLGMAALACCFCHCFFCFPRCLQTSRSGSRLSLSMRRSKQAQGSDESITELQSCKGTGGDSQLAGPLVFSAIPNNT